MKTHFFIDETSFNEPRLKLLNEIASYHRSHKTPNAPEAMVVHIPQSQWLRISGFLNEKSLPEYEKKYPNLSFVVEGPSTASRAYIEKFQSLVSKFANRDDMFARLAPKPDHVEDGRVLVVKRYRKLAKEHHLPVAEGKTVSRDELTLQSGDFSTVHDQCVLAAFATTAYFQGVANNLVVPRFQDAVDVDMRRRMEKFLEKDDYAADSLILLTRDRKHVNAANAIIAQHDIDASERALALSDNIFILACGTVFRRKDQSPEALKIYQDNFKQIQRESREMAPIDNVERHQNRAEHIKEAGNKALRLMGLPGTLHTKSHDR